MRSFALLLQSYRKAMLRIGYAGAVLRLAARLSFVISVSQRMQLLLVFRRIDLPVPW